ncbi:hypothetical protein [uncultured Tenacibaculum sp.]|uniref:hypothetical protein n=1 Tax=uncultured Tenacibaculum sp. TaxID=174713 RepID=UPI0026120A1F|nr:hypothetical protein [uncultured Tenacibaculum sp.]
MKKRMYLNLMLVLTLILTTVGCSEDEFENSLEGTWNVVGLQGGLAQGITYDKGDIIWNISFKTNTITIVNSIETPTTQNFSHNHSGVYSFTIETDTNGYEVLVVGERRGYIKFEEEALLIDYGIAFDDIAYTLVR